MRTRIYLEREPPRGPGRLPTYNIDGPYIDVNHEDELDADDVAALRDLGRLGVAHLHDDRVVIPATESAQAE